MIFDESGNPLLDEQIDLSRGYIAKRISVRSTAEPIDNIKKFAWSDDDYEEIRVYIPYSQDRIEMKASPSPDEDRDAMLVDIEYRLTLLELGLQEV